MLKNLTLKVQEPIKSLKISQTPQKSSKINLQSLQKIFKSFQKLNKASIKLMKAPRKLKKLNKFT